MKNSILKILISALFLLISHVVSFGQNNQGWSASKETEERLSKDRPEFNFYESKVPSYTLPDLLTGGAGKKITGSGDWLKIRRPELLELFKKEVFGRVPAIPYQKMYKIISEDRNALGGSATLQEIDVTLTSGGKSLVIRLNLFIPNKAQKPVPAFLLISLGAKNIDPTRQVKSESWPVEEIIARGYAAAAFSNSDVDPDNFDDFRNGIHGLLDRGARTNDSWGTLAGWAWGASRCLDYLITVPAIRKERIAIVGHSRGGKTALWAGAEDQRFGMVIANESGCGGAAIARRKLGETVDRINTSFPHWFCLNYRKYNNNEDSMPFDMHMLLSLTAPRPLYIDAADEDLWGDPKGCYLALYNSLPAYRLFNKKTSLPENVPPMNTQVISGNVGFHIRDGGHALSLRDWNYIMDFADRVWK